MLDVPVKSPGDSVFAAEITSMSSEEENIITDAGITLSGGDLFQISKAVANYVASGDYYTDTGAADAYVINVLASKKATTLYAVGTRVRFEPANANIGPSTINVSSLGVKAIVKSDGTALVGGELLENTEITLSFDGTAFRIVSNSHSSINTAVTKKFRDCILTNNAGDPAKDLDFGPGYFRADNADVVFHVPSTIVKQADVAWANGTATGGSSVLPLVTSTWLHAFYIAAPDGSVNAGWDTSITAANLMAAAASDGYIYYARRTSTYIDSGDDISPCYNKDDEFFWGGTTLDVTTVTNSFVAATVQTPLGVVVKAYLSFGMQGNAGGVTTIVYRSSLIPSQTIGAMQVNLSDYDVTQITALVDANSQIEHKWEGAVPITYNLEAHGYKELYS